MTVKPVAEDVFGFCGEEKVELEQTLATIAHFTLVRYNNPS